jgi:hypothetical protein
MNARDIGLESVAQEAIIESRERSREWLGAVW